MITLAMSSLSTQNLQVLINVLSPSGTYSPVNDPVQFAFTLESYPEVQPGNGDWNTGSWAVYPGPQYWVQCLVGPVNGVTLAQGLYQVWVKITDNPSVPVLQQVYLQVTP